MNKPKIIILEGSQGAGKTTLTNMLREKIPHSTLMRLSGIKDKSKSASKKVLTLRDAELNLLSATNICGTTYILDRCHLSEKVYCNLKYKEYDFIEETKYLNEKLNELTNKYDIYIITMLVSDFTSQTDILKNRDKAEIEYAPFSTKSSAYQQLEYKKELENIKINYPKINILELENNNTVEENFNHIIKFCGVNLDAN
jgi:hypothetical protein